MKLRAWTLVAVLVSTCGTLAAAQNIPLPVQKDPPPRPSSPVYHSSRHAPVPTSRAAPVEAEAYAPRPMRRLLPAGTMLVVTPANEITSKRIEEGEQIAFMTVNDVVENGAVAIPRGSHVGGTVSWKTGRAIGGKSGKFEITFNSISVQGRDYALRGSHRQEGRGNTVGALLGSIVISGRSAVMLPGQLVNVFTAEAVVY
jgi:hypothetical protein